MGTHYRHCVWRAIFTGGGNGTVRDRNTREIRKILLYAVGGGEMSDFTSTRGQTQNTFQSPSACYENGSFRTLRPVAWFPRCTPQKGKTKNARIRRVLFLNVTPSTDGFFPPCIGRTRYLRARGRETTCSVVLSVRWGGGIKTTRIEWRSALYRTAEQGTKGLHLPKSKQTGVVRRMERAATGTRNRHVNTGFQFSRRLINRQPR